MAAGYRTKWLCPGRQKSGHEIDELNPSSPTAYHMVGKVGRLVMKYAPFAVNNKLNPWYKQRDMPEPPKESFGEWYAKNRKA